MIEPLRISFSVECSAEHAFDRTRSGEEIGWGVIVERSRPRRLRYTWHIATDPKNATHVEIVFRRESRATTRVEIEHGGWERLGEIGPAWRESNHAGWDGVLPAYREACAARS